MLTENTSPLFHEIDTRSLVDKVETQLIQLFINRELKPGDSIPKEVELAESMNVSRTVIRETLTRLKTRGLIDSKKHKGTVIKSPDLSSLLQKSMIPWMLDDATLKDIFELRLVLEVGMADFIFNHITSEDIADLYKIVEGEPEDTENVLFDIEHETLFHGKLYQITRNRTLMEFQKVLITAFHHAYMSGFIVKPVTNKKYMSHKELVDILAAGTPSQFRKGMRKHLENHFQRIAQLDME
ncbi:MAG: FadR family transcriptional regulator [Breznakibacter sp.]|nr:FadR family transcriptional regulator [Breznakibacter sp.]